MTLIFPFMQPISSAQPDSIGMSRATGFPCFCNDNALGLQMIQQRKALFLEFRCAQLLIHTCSIEQNF